MAKQPAARPPAQPAKPRCGNCRFWHRTGHSAKDGEAVGQCRYLPPDVLTPELTADGPILIHGATRASQGCFRFEPQPGDRPHNSE